eukprot:363291-Chlamydomonas_euryale.AAC.3
MGQLACHAACPMQPAPCMLRSLSLCTATSQCHTCTLCSRLVAWRRTRRPAHLRPAACVVFPDACHAVEAGGREEAPVGRPAARAHRARVRVLKDRSATPAAIAAASAVGVAVAPSLARLGRGGRHPDARGLVAAAASEAPAVWAPCNMPCAVAVAFQYRDARQAP